MRRPVTPIKGLVVLTCLWVSIICLPQPAPAAEAVEIYYEQNAQVELIAPLGTRVLIDTTAPDILSHPAEAADVLLTTHSHGDHRRLDFIKVFPGRQLDIQSGRIRLPEADITGIASSHHEDGDFRKKGGSNYIFVVEMAGLRIAHFGDIGQAAFTEDQLAAIGRVDIAFTQLANRFSNMTAENQKGFKLMDQLKPRLIIPTHIFQPICAEMAVAKWAAFETYKRVLTIGSADLPAETTIVFMGRNADLVKLPYTKW